MNEEKIFLEQKFYEELNELFNKYQSGLGILKDSPSVILGVPNVILMKKEYGGLVYTRHLTYECDIAFEGIPDLSKEFKVDIQAL